MRRDLVPAVFLFSPRFTVSLIPLIPTEIGFMAQRTDTYPYRYSLTAKTT
jgi:hypothetical protein